MIAALAIFVTAALVLIWALRRAQPSESGSTRSIVISPELLEQRRGHLREEQRRLESDLDLQRGVFEVSSELVGCVDETDLHARLSAALSRYWTGDRLELLVWERGSWRSLGGSTPAGAPDLGAPVHLPEDDDSGSLVLDLSPAVDGQAALVLHRARSQPPLAVSPTEQRRGVAELLRGQFALSLRRVVLFRSLQELARTDPLTGTWRRWYGEARLAELVDGGAVVTTCIVDIDHFKKVNDTHGHAAGDRVLAAVGRCLAAHVRHEDLVARLGGEEFLILLPNTPPLGAMHAAERMRSAVAALADLPSSVTVSIGLASCRRDETPGELLARADAAMYRAKSAGRDRVESSDGPETISLVRSEAVRRDGSTSAMRVAIGHTSSGTRRKAQDGK